MSENNVRTRLLQNIAELQDSYRYAQKELENWGELAPKLYAIWQELDRYHPGDEPHKAVYLVAQCCTMLEPFARSYGIVHQHEEARRKLEEYDTRRAIEDG